MLSLKDYQEKKQWLYNRPSLAIDGVLLRYHGTKLQVLLLKRSARYADDANAGRYALVGGFQPNGMTLEDNLLQKIEEKTGFAVQPYQTEQLATFSEPERDSRLWVVSVAYLVYLSPDMKVKKRVNTTDEMYWANLSVDASGDLQLVMDDQQISQSDFAFDHYDILRAAMKRIRNRLSYLPSILQILPALNTMTAYRQLYGQFDPKFLTMNSTDFLRKHKQFFTKTNQKVKTSKRQASLFAWQIQKDL
ncbi:NUDIX hydrolase [Streptococcus dentiloxodontae]